MQILRFFLMTAGLLCISACGGGGYSVSGVPKAAAAPAMIAGNWWLIAIPNSTPMNQIDVSGVLGVSGNSVSISTKGNGGGCFTAPLVLSGSTSGGTATLTTPPAAATTPGFVLTVVANTSNGSNMDGTYQLAGGTEAKGGSCFASVGTVYGTLVPPLAGTYSGPVTEDQYPSGGNNGAAPVGYLPNLAALAVSMTQATVPQIFGTTATGQFSAFPLSGTMTWTNSQCFGSGTIDPTQSYAVGNLVNVAVINAAGGQYPSYTLVFVLSDPSRATVLSLSSQPAVGACAGYQLLGLPSIS